MVCHVHIDPTKQIDRAPVATPLNIIPRIKQGLLLSMAFYASLDYLLSSTSAVKHSSKRHTKQGLILRFHHIFTRAHFAHGHHRKRWQKGKRFRRIVQQIKRKYLATRKHEVRTDSQCSQYRSALVIAIFDENPFDVGG